MQRNHPRVKIILLINEIFTGKFKNLINFLFTRGRERERERVRAGNREKKINSDKRGETNAG